MTSMQAKRKLDRWISGYGNQYMGGVWEASNLANADFLAVKWNGKITEFEIKVSLADLRGEVACIREAMKQDVMESAQSMFWPELMRVRRDIRLSHTKIQKHHHYLVKHRRAGGYEGSEDPFYPNQFYFAVPADLVGAAKALVAGLPYGVFDLDSMAYVLKGKSLRNEPHSSATFKDLFNRSCVLRADLRRELENSASN